MKQRLFGFVVVGSVSALAACSQGSGSDADFFGEHVGQPRTATNEQALSSGRADLVATLAGPANAGVSETATYDVEVKNEGGSRARNTKVTMGLPPNLVVVSLPQGCAESAAPHEVVCSLGTLQAGASAVRSISVELPSTAGSVDLTASVTTRDRESNLGNNDASLTTTVTAQPPPTYAPVLNAPQILDASDCFDVESYAECHPDALLYATLVLESGGTVDTGMPGVTGTWSQPGGPTTIEMVFKDSYGSWLSTFSGAGVSATCFEGSIDGAYAVGAFRACTP